MKIFRLVVSAWLKNTCVSCTFLCVINKFVSAESKTLNSRPCVNKILEVGVLICAHIFWVRATLCDHSVSPVRALTCEWASHWHKKGESKWDAALIVMEKRLLSDCKTKVCICGASHRSSSKPHNHSHWNGVRPHFESPLLPVDHSTRTINNQVLKGKCGLKVNRFSEKDACGYFNVNALYSAIRMTIFFQLTALDVLENWCHICCSKIYKLRAKK